MNALFLALLVGSVVYFLWQWDSDSRRRRAAMKAGSRSSSRPLPPRVPLSTWLARVAVAAIAAWMVFLAITLFRSAT